MPEHVHYFRLQVEGPECNECQYSAIIGLAVCGCGEVLGPTAIERRLNATERLSAEDARGLSKHLRSAARELGELLARDYGDTTVQNFQVTDEKDELLAYASALEGEDA